MIRWYWTKFADKPGFSFSKTKQVKTVSSLGSCSSTVFPADTDNLVTEKSNKTQNLFFKQID